MSDSFHSVYSYDTKNNYSCSLIKVIDYYQEKLFLYPKQFSNKLKNKIKNNNSHELLEGEYCLCQVVKVHNNLALIKPYDAHLNHGNINNSVNENINEDNYNNDYITLEIHYLINSKSFLNSLESINPEYLNSLKENCVKQNNNSKNNDKSLNDIYISYTTEKNIAKVVEYLNHTGNSESYNLNFKVLYENSNGEILIVGLEKDLQLLLDLINILKDENENLEVVQFIIKSDTTKNKNDNNFNSNIQVTSETFKENEVLEYIKSFVYKDYIDISASQLNKNKFQIIDAKKINNTNSNNELSFDKIKEVTNGLVYSYINDIKNSIISQNNDKNFTEKSLLALNYLIFYLIKYNQEFKLLVVSDYYVKEVFPKEASNSNTPSFSPVNYSLRIIKINYKQYSTTSINNLDFSKCHHKNLFNSSHSINSCSDFCFIIEKDISERKRRKILCKNCQIVFIKKTLENLILELKISGNVLYDSTSMYFSIVIFALKSKIEICEKLVLVQELYWKQVFEKSLK